MNVKSYLLAGVAVLAGFATLPATAQTGVTTNTTTTVVPTVEGGTVYESKTVTKSTAPEGQRPVVFYYYDAKAGEIIAADTVTEDIFKLWDVDGNGHISPQEFYRNAMVIYEPVETRTQVFADVDGNGRLELTKEEYTLRLAQVPHYADINKDGKPGISAHEFLGTGFQDADRNDDNQVSYSEFTDAFYGQPKLASDQNRYN